MKYNLTCVRAHSVFVPAGKLKAYTLGTGAVDLLPVPAFRSTTEEGAVTIARTKAAAEQLIKTGLWAKKD
jgi:hypothetical protein